VTKEKSKNQELEQFSRGMFLTRFSDWVVNSLDGEDYAFDFEVRPTGKFVDPLEVRQSPFFVQLKATERFDDPEEVWYDFEVDYLLDDCLSASIPVVLCLYERGLNRFSWCVIQLHCWDVLDDEKPNWRSQSMVRVRTPQNSLQGTLGKRQLLQAVDRAQRRITMRASIASKRRGTFSHPPGTMLASTEEVRTHKSDIVEDARLLAMAEHTDRALRRFMQVFQLPEDDRPTLEAVCYLLELRQITAPHIAFAKLRMANHGISIANELGTTDICDYLEETIDDACDYIEEEFIGARYFHEFSARECLVLDVVNRGRGTGLEAAWVATLQDSMGDIEMETAGALSGGEEYELIESGSSFDPRDDACSEGDHDFDAEELRRYHRAAVCSQCGLTNGVIGDWLGQDVPKACPNCNSIVDRIEIRGREEGCTHCIGEATKKNS